MVVISRAQAALVVVAAILLTDAPSSAQRGPKGPQGPVHGSGTPGTIPQWTGPATLGDSVIVGSGKNIGIGTAPSPIFRLTVGGDIASGNIQANGGITASAGIRAGTAYFLDRGTSNPRILFGDLKNNTATGFDSLSSNTTGSDNTATGNGALFFNTTGFGNTSTGAFSLSFNTTGGANTGTGGSALGSNTAGSENTATGFGALFSNTTGSFNTADGVNALRGNTSGHSNSALGDQALLNNTTGSGNIAIGATAGANATTGSDNIYIGHPGVMAESAAIRIGTAGAQTSTFIAGISGATVAGSTVLIDANGRLGTVLSSREFKDDIRDMGVASDALMRLRPVTFRYKSDTEHGRQYGLIAEEVGDVYPELLVRDKEGAPLSVAYHALPALLLNEMQKQHSTIEAQAQTIRELEQEMRLLRERAMRVAETVERLAGIKAAAAR